LVLVSVGLKVELAATRQSTIAWFTCSCRQGQNARSGKKRKDAFWRQFDEKPSIILGCPDAGKVTFLVLVSVCWKIELANAGQKAAC